jgi:predicted nucleotidyltransferase
MRPSEALARHREEIRRIVSDHRSSNPRVFGSVLHGEDAEGSDLDLLIDPAPETSLMDLARIQGRLEDLMGIPVDVLTPLSLPESYRGRILGEARPV